MRPATAQDPAPPMSAQPPDPGSAEPLAPARPRRRSVLTALVAALTVVLVVAWLWLDREDPADRAAAPPTSEVATVPVTAGPMVEETDVRGVLHHVDAVPVTSSRSGVVTSLPAPGTVLAPGDALYTVDTRPVVLLAGVMPAWRTFQVGMTDGEDVAQLERNLVDLGWLGGTPDGRYTTETATAVRSWQRALGVARTGVVERSAIMFADQPLRVAALSARLGADVTPGVELYTTSGTDKVVDVDLDLADQQLAVPGATVTVVLPDGTELAATVAGVGEAVERPAADGGAGRTVVPVNVGLADQAAAAAFAQADVTVRFASTLGQDLLTVPVEALVAIDSSTFGVEVPDPERAGRTTVVPVTVGAFASGRVAISGEGIEAGLHVVVPAP
jgi:peptidoglycan hydrolase-like protein with peptidoglycan-binding domain